MTRRLLLATCRHKPELTPSDALLAGHARALGAAVGAVPWDEIAPGDLGDAVVCLRSTWDYHRRSDEFRAWIGALRDRDVHLVNAAATVLWNMDKKYLGELHARGIAIPETRWIAPGESIDLPGLLSAAGWERAVLKPRISATAYGTHLVTRHSSIGAGERTVLQDGGALLQAFVPEIQSAGEMSLIFIDGRFSHAVEKRPAAGDFRVQHEFGGSVTAAEAGSALREFGARALAAVPSGWTFARVDLVPAARGPILMELELIEPDLFFTPGGEGAARLAAALLRPAPPSKGR